MLYRHKEPNKEKWNGIGGKIEPGESVCESLAREVREEAGLRLEEARAVSYRGIVTWSGEEVTVGVASQGMYAFLAEFGVEHRVKNKERMVEGVLAWQPLDWVLDETNEAVVDNVAHFLSGMLRANEPRQWHCDYRNGVLHGVEERILEEAYDLAVVGLKDIG